MSKSALQEVPPAPPIVEVALTVEDLIRIQLISERKQRLAAELRAAELDERLFIIGANARYGVDLGEYVIDMVKGTATKRS